MQLEFPSSRRSISLSRLKIGVLAGGLSSERKISLRSGRAVLRALRKAGFDPIHLDPRQSGRFQRHLTGLDVAFIALHGRGGEDGSIQRQLERCGVAYVGSNPASCRASFYKDKAKARFLKEGIPTPPYTLINPSNWRRVLRRFPTPFFVKPVDDGSSIGVFCVEDFGKSAVKIIKAVKKYRRLLVEQKIDGREFTVGVVGSRPLQVIEIRPRRAFYDYRAKYTKGMTRYLVPAPISKKLSSLLRALAVKVHKVLALRDFSRVDFMVDRRGRPYVLEANAIPGLTELSLLPKAARAAGISFENLCAGLVQRAHLRRVRS